MVLTSAGTGGTCNRNPIAKCFNAVTVAFTSECVLTVSPNDPGSSSDVLVPALFSAAASYSELVACPAAGAAALSVTIGSDAAVLTGLRAVLNGAIWSEAVATVGALAASGGVLSTTDTSTGEDCALTWQIVSSTVRQSPSSASRGSHHRE
jgi:hypothetical protein